MDRVLSTLLEELHRQGVEHDARTADRLERCRNLEPDSAAVLALLVRATAARRVLELGTSNGYSTLWLADAARSIGGQLVSVELDRARSEQAAAHLEQAGLTEWVELRVEDAAQALSVTGDGAFDMVFLDAERPAYAAYWPELVRVLRGGGLLVVDNVLSHADEVSDFRSLVRCDERVREALVPSGAGLLLVVRESVS